MQSQSTLFFDRGVFRTGGNVFFQVYTVAGQKRFSPLRKVIFGGSDGIVFVVDSQRDQWAQNVDALAELVALTERRGKKLVQDYPLIIMLNKMDLPSRIESQHLYSLLNEFGLIYPAGHALAIWNPLVYETIAIRGDNVARAFAECARRVILYHTQGNGRAPIF
jgi:GTPase SAR1 family protein